MENVKLLQRMSITASSLLVKAYATTQTVDAQKHACFCHILKIVWRQCRDRKYVASVDSNFVSSLPT